MTTKKHYLHRDSQLAPNAVLTKHYQTKKEGSHGGLTFRHIEGDVARCDPNRRFAIQVVSPTGKQDMMVFGGFEQINSLAKEIETSPEAVMKQLRSADGSPLASGAYQLDRPAPPLAPPKQEPTPESRRGAAMFPNQGEENRPYTTKQKEDRDLKAHRKSVGLDQDEISPTADPTVSHLGQAALDHEAAEAAR